MQAIVECRCLQSQLIAPNIFRVDHIVARSDIDDTGFEPARDRAVEQRAVGCLIVQRQRRGKGTPAPLLVGRHRAEEIKTANALALFMAVASAKRDLKLVAQRITALGVEADRVDGHGALLEIVKRIKCIGGQPKQDAQIGEGYPHAAKQFFVEIHCADNCIEFVARIAANEFLAERLAVLVIVVLAKQIGIRRIKVIAVETLELVVGRNRFHIPVARRPFNRTGKAVTIALVQRFLIGIDVAQIGLPPCRGGDREDRLSAQNGAELVFRSNRGPEIMESIVAVLFVKHFARQQNVYPWSDFEKQAPAQRISVTIIDILAREFVDAISIAAIIFPGYPDHDILAGDRATDTAFDAERVIVAIGQPGIAIEFIGRALGDKVDRAGSGAPAIQRSLRPTQHFDTLKIIEARELRCWPGNLRTVLQEGDAAIRTQIDAGQADAANENTIYTKLVADRQVGNS